MEDRRHVAWLGTNKERWHLPFFVNRIWPSWRIVWLPKPSEASHGAPDPNRAILFTREGKAERALEVLRARAPGELAVRFACAEAFALSSLDRPEDAHARLRSELETSEGPTGAEDRAMVLPLMAEYSVRSGEADRARLEEMEALELSRGDSKALWCLRGLEGKRSFAAHSWKLMLEGSFDDSIDDTRRGMGFFVSCVAVAESAEDAFQRAAAMESESLRASLKFSEATDEGPRPDVA